MKTTSQILNKDPVRTMTKPLFGSNISKRSMVTDAIILIRKITQTSADIDRFGIIDTMDTNNRSVNKEFQQDQDTLMHLMNKIYQNEKNLLIYKRSFIDDLEFSMNILNLFYMKYFKEFIASPTSTIIYRGLRSSFKVYDVSNHKMRIYILEKSRANGLSLATRQINNKRGTIENEEIFRSKLMMMSKSNIMPPVVFSAIIPVFHGAGVLDHIQYIVEHNEYKKITNIRRDAALSASSLDEDWDNILNTSSATQSRPSHKIRNDINTINRPRAIGSIGKDMGFSFVYAILIPQRMSTTLRSALLQRNDRIDNSLGPEIQTLFASFVANDFISYDFTLEDILIEVREDGVIKRVLLGYLDFYQDFDIKLTRKDMPGPNKDLDDTNVLFSLLFYCSALIQIFRLNIAGNMISFNNTGYISFIPQDPLIAFIHVTTNGSVSVALNMLNKVMKNKNSTAHIHINKVLRLWLEARERTKHLEQHLHFIQPSTSPGSLEDILKTMLSQYENVSFRDPIL